MKKYNITFSKLTTYLLGTVLSTLCFVITSCSKDDTPPTPNPTKSGNLSFITLPDSLTPDTIYVEMREGHSHLPHGEEPNRGVTYWSKRNSGFHANPYFPDTKFPLKSFQQMVLVRQADGQYKVDTKLGVDAFRVQSSPTKGGLWNALLIYMYNKKGQRIDLTFRSKKDSMSQRTQMFYTISNAQPIVQTVPQGITQTDTTIIINKDSGLPDSTLEALKKVGYYNTPIPVRYRTAAPIYTAGTPSRDLFYYWYYDRATDNIDDSPIMNTPIGFRGVFANKTPFVSYDVNMMLTVLPKGQTQKSLVSDEPTAEQLKNVVFNIQIPFRNIMEKIDAQAYVPKVVSDIVNKADKYYIEDELYDKYYNVGLYINILREFPGFNMQQIRDWYQEQLRNSNPESSNFWL